MRLINTTSYQLEDFHSQEGIKYAILSHRWENGEVSYQDMLIAEYQHRKGWIKIAQCCQKAANSGICYLWVDTCCIDKSSSAELSEAINSMFVWYSDAVICYAYLSDVTHANSSIPELQSRFEKSLWFTRGWTLQELLAPKTIHFYDTAWCFLGTKTDLGGSIQSATGIPVKALLASLLGTSLATFSIAERMSWASERVTTRGEDIAYSLMGLFDVNMPMLYGEGKHKAFMRLQEEIIKTSNDQSIFAWRSFSTDPYPCGLLASCPSNFARNTELMPPSSGSTLPQLMATSFSLTNAGLSIKLQILPYKGSIDIALLECSRNKDFYVGIFVERFSLANQFLRVRPEGEKDVTVFDASIANQPSFRSVLRRIQLTVPQIKHQVHLLMNSKPQQTMPMAYGFRFPRNQLCIPQLNGARESWLNAIKPDLMRQVVAVPPEGGIKLFTFELLVHQIRMEVTVGLGYSSDLVIFLHKQPQRACSDPSNLEDTAQPVATYGRAFLRSGQSELPFCPSVDTAVTWRWREWTDHEFGLIYTGRAGDHDETTAKYLTALAKFEPSNIVNERRNPKHAKTETWLVARRTIASGKPPAISAAITRFHKSDLQHTVILRTDPPVRLHVHREYDEAQEFWDIEIDTD